ncbi:MAG: phospho-N-acetylmuramoyl-pentapeptide-transferase [Verrucomicrobiota bacterium]
MLYYLSQFSDQVEVANLFRYITVRAAGAAVFAFLFVLLTGRRFIRLLLSLKVGQPIRTADEVHKLAELHGGKAGTPTMGGLMTLLAVVLATILFARLSNPFVSVTLVVTLLAGLVGFADDYTKVKQRNSGGISARAKLGGQVLIGLGAALFLLLHPLTGDYMSEFWVPFLKEPLFASAFWLVLLMIPFVITGTSNAVNLTDGLDGLAAGSAVSVALCFTVLSYLGGATFLIGETPIPIYEYLFIPHHPELAELAIFAAALMGALLGFLWFNCHPAKVFMGDTGSLSLGAAIAMLAICTHHELLLVLVGGVFVIEALSVIIQVTSFKTRGKRVFRMSPIHHHFELKGWHENQVIIRFWILSFLLALAGMATLKLR